MNINNVNIIKKFRIGVDKLKILDNTRINQIKHDNIINSILSKTIKDDDHIIIANDKRQNKEHSPTLTIDGHQRSMLHWLYICYNKKDPHIDLNMIRLCDNAKCINIEHWIEKNDENALYIKGMNYLLKKSTQISTCRLWKSINKITKYGDAKFNNKSISAHILSYMIHNKITEIPNEQVVRHKCRNRNCIVIDHLELGTPKNNGEDKIRDGTSGRGSKNSNAKITEELALQIYQSKSNYLTQKDRAIKFNVSKNTIKDIDCGKSWSHITGHKKCEEKRNKHKINENTPNDIYLEAQQRIEENIVKIIDDETKQEHWTWIKNITPNGYGTVKFKGYTMLAHRLSWMAYNKTSIDENLDCLHRCKQNRDCVNPEHLYLGTPKQNGQDKIKDGTSRSFSKITEETAEAIMKSKEQGTAKERSIKYGVTHAHVRAIDCGKCWLDLRKKLNIPLTKRGIIKPKKSTIKNNMDEPNLKFERPIENNTDKPKLKLKQPIENNTDKPKLKLKST